MIMQVLRRAGFLSFALAILTTLPVSLSAQTPARSIWQRETTPNIGAANVLSSLSADSETDIWSVGDFVSLHFDGSAWTAFPLVPFQTNQPSEDTMNGVAVVSSANVWAVGTVLVGTVSCSSHLIGLIENFDGRSGTWCPVRNLLQGLI